LTLVSPNGIMFVKPEIRKSLLAKMLSEILDTRVMIKKTMKDYNEDSVKKKKKKKKKMETSIVDTVNSDAFLFYGRAFCVCWMQNSSR
jgi:DNA polymerase zeta